MRVSGPYLDVAGRGEAGQLERLYVGRPGYARYRHQLRPVITKGATTMNTIFNQQKQAKSA